MDIEEAVAHAGSLLKGDGIYGAPEWVEERVQDVMAHYIWTWQDGRKKSGVCTRCHERIDRLDKLKISIPRQAEYESSFCGDFATDYWWQKNYDGTAHSGKTGLCPICGEEVQFKSLSKGRTHLEEKMMLVEYQKSEIDPSVLACVGYRVFIPWSEMDDDQIIAPIYITPMELCVFRWGKGGQRFVRETEWYPLETRAGKQLWTKRVKRAWKKRRDCVSGYTGQRSYMGCDGTRVILDETAFDAAVEGTRWQEILPKLPWTLAGDHYDRITLMDRVAQYPCVEYLLRMRCTELAKMVIDKQTEGLLYVRGKTARAVLRLTADEWGAIKGQKIRVTPELLAVLKINRDNGYHLSMGAMKTLADHRDSKSMITLKESHPEISMRAACKYVRRQRTRLGDYMDYLRKCHVLGADTTDRQVLWPTDLRAIHQRYNEQIRQINNERQLQARMLQVRKNKELTGRMAERRKALESAYTFRACGLVMSPFETAEEIIREGARQSICIGSYVERYADGKTILCKLRREGAEDEPFHAVEFTTAGQMVQCRGKNNQTFDTDEQVIREFWAAWDEARGTKTDIHIYIKKTEQKEGGNAA